MHCESTNKPPSIRCECAARQAPEALTTRGRPDIMPTYGIVRPVAIGRGVARTTACHRRESTWER